MPVKIQNLTNRPVLFRLNNGRTLHLPPQFVSHEINDAQILNNSKIKKLEERRIIVLHPVAEKKSTTPGPAKSKRASTEAEK